MSSTSTSPIGLSDPIGRLLRSARIPAPTSAAPRRPAVEFGAEGLAPRPMDTGVSAEEWRTFNSVSANVLIVGSEDLQASLWRAVWPTLKKPVCWADGKQFWLPSGPVPTLIVQEVGRLNQLQQTRLLEWLHLKKNDTRVLATTRLPLYALVEGGKFVAALYYLLNPLTLKLSGQAAPAQLAVAAATS